MRLLSAVSVVLLNAATSAAKSLSMTEGGFHGNIDFYSNAGISDATFLRRLQLMTESTCNADGSVNFQLHDDFIAVAFDAQYNPMCTYCDEENNFDTVLNAETALGQAVLQNSTTQEELQSLTDAFNEAVGNYSSKADYQCMNGCEICFDDLCGILETSSQQSEYSTSPGNYTTEQIVGGNYQLNPSFSNYETDCITYTKNESGKLCIYNNVSVTADGEFVTCFIEYDDVMCKSCEYQPPATADDVGCGKADCTNIDANANIDTCAGTGDVGPFKFLKYYGGSVSSNGTISVGSCNASIPPAPTPTMEPPTDAGGVPTAPTPAAPTNGAAPPTAPTPASTSGAAVMTGLRATLLALLMIAAAASLA